MSPEIAGMSLFISCAFLTFVAKSIRKSCKHSKNFKTANNTLPSQKQEEMIIEYKSLLNRLIENDTRPQSPSAKLMSRHDATGDVIFQKRKTFFRSVLDRCGIKHSCKIIHVAGTKGKGSTVEYISSGLIGSGSNVGIFSSPHLHTARERLKIGREIISIEDLIRIGKKTLALFEDCNWSYVMFDKMVTLALHYFGERDIEYMVLETGIGGRYDSTNFAESVAACVITSISLDHQALLGNTLEEIAWQKAGIIKKGSHVFTSANQKECVLDVIRKQCTSLDAILHIIDSDRSSLDGLELHTPYKVQVENACLAAAVLRHLDVSCSGMKNFYWPCRMEAFHLTTATDSLVVLDGCHNEDSVVHFLEGLQERYPSRKVLTMFGAGDEKCVQEMLLQVVQRSHSVVLLRSKHMRAVSEMFLWNSISEENKGMVLLLTDKETTTIAEKMTLLLDDLTSKGTTGDYVVAICGSLFVASEARECLYRMDPTLFDPQDWVTQSDY